MSSDADLLHPTQRSAFISYSRADLPFAGRVDDALCEAGRTTWIDRSGIEPTEEWLAAIYAGIDRSDNFVLVVTPQAVASPWCAKEVEYAAARNKRLVPVLAKPTDPASLPPLIAARQWIDVTADFDAGMTKLIEALDRDLAYVREHTRLLARAIDWKKGQGGLLSRAEVDVAERWLANARSEPAPAPLHTELIVSSRRAVTRTQRRIVVAAVIATVVSLTLGLFALLQRNEARRQTAAATRNLANTLAARAVGNVKPREALRGAVSAIDTAVTPTTLDALLRVLQRTDQLRVILDPAADAAHHRGLAIDDDGARLAIAPYVSGLEVWDLRTGAHQVTDIHNSGAEKVPVAISGGLIATRSGVWREDQSKPFFELGQPQALALSGSQWLAAAGTDYLEVCNLGNRMCKTTQARDVRHVAFAGADARIVVTAVANRADIRDAATLGVLRSATFPSGIKALAGNRKRPEVTLVLADGGVCTLDVLTATSDCDDAEGEDSYGLHTVKRTFGAVSIGESTIALGGDGRLLAVTDYDAAIGLVGIDVSIAVWDSSLQQGELAPLRHIVDGAVAAVSHDGSRVLLRDADGRVTLTDTVSGTRVGQPFSPAGRVVACTRSIVAAAGAALTLHDAVSGAVRARVPLTRTPVSTAAFSPDGSLLAVRSAGRVRFYDVPSGRAVGQELPIGERNFVLMHGRRSLLAFTDDSIEEWNADTGEHTPRPLHKGSATGWDDDDAGIHVLAVSPDGRRIATNGGGWAEGMTPRIVLWDLEHGSVIDSHAYADAVGGISTIAFGDGVIVAGDDDGLRLFDARTLAPIGTAIVLKDSTLSERCSAHVTADGKYAGLACDQRATMFSLDVREWRRVALQRAGGK